MVLVAVKGVGGRMLRRRNADVFCERGAQAGSLVRPLYDLMSTNKPGNMDILFMGKVPDMCFASKSIAGQSGHQSNYADGQSTERSPL